MEALPFQRRARFLVRYIVKDDLQAFQRRVANDAPTVKQCVLLRRGSGLLCPVQPAESVRLCAVSICAICRRDKGGIHQRGLVRVQLQCVDFVRAAQGKALRVLACLLLCYAQTKARMDRVP